MPIRTLTQSVDHLTEEAHALRDMIERLEADIEAQNKINETRNRLIERDIRSKTVTTRIALVLIFVLLVIATTISLDNARAISDFGQKLCPVLLVQVQKPGDPPRTTDAGRSMAREAANVARLLECRIQPSEETP
jgi:hypothetical protein